MHRSAGSINRSSRPMQSESYERRRGEGQKVEGETGVAAVKGQKVVSAPNQRGQRGRSKATIELFIACHRIIEEVQPITVRGVCYRLFVAGLIDSMATKNTQKISRLLVDAREEGIIPWEWIVDDSRRMEGDGGFTDLEQYARIVQNSYRRDFWAHQRERVIIVSEKATVAGIVRPVLEEFGVPFFPVHGFNSATKIYDLCQEIHRDNRVYYFLYIGDHDPSGMFMSEEDFPQRLERYTPADPRLKQLGINTEALQVFGATYRP
jgi:hypothetical protein